MKKDSGNVGEAFKSGALRDRAWLFFQKNSKFISIVSVAIACILAAIFVHRAWEAFRVTAMQRAYVNIATLAGRQAFVRKYDGHALAGFVAMSIGDTYLSNGKYEDAMASYEKAGKILKKNIAFPRAEIWRAVAAHKLGHSADAEEILRAVVCNKNLDKAFRGEAALALASMFKDCGDSEKLNVLSAEIDGMELSQGASNAVHYVAGGNHAVQR